MRVVEITLIGKPECHLCEDAEAAVVETLAELAEQGINARLTKLNILQDAELARLHGEAIPVVQVNGRRHSFWTVDRQRLTAAVLRAARAPRSLRSRAKKEQDS